GEMHGRETALDSGPAHRETIVGWGKRPDTVNVVGQDYGGVDRERMFRDWFAKGMPEEVDHRGGSQKAVPIKRKDGKEDGCAGAFQAAVFGHVDMVARRGACGVRGKRCVWRRHPTSSFSRHWQTSCQWHPCGQGKRCV